MARGDRVFRPQKGSMSYAVLLILYQEGACPSGRQPGLKKGAIGDKVVESGLARVLPDTPVTIKKDGRYITITALDCATSTLTDPEHHNPVATHRQGYWMLVDEGERIARSLCCDHGIPLPAWDAQHAESPQQQQQQQQRRRRPQQQGASPQAGRQRRQQQQRSGQQPAARHSGPTSPPQTPLASAGQAAQAPVLTPAAAGGAAALRRAQDEQWQADQQTLRQAAEEGELAGGSRQEAVTLQYRLAGHKRSAPDGDVVDLLDSDEDDGLPPFRPLHCRQQQRMGTGGIDDSVAAPAAGLAAADPSGSRMQRQQQLRLQEVAVRQLAEMLQVPHRAAQQLLAAHGGNLQAAAEAYLEGEEAPPHASQWQEQQQQHQQSQPGDQLPQQQEQQRWQLGEQSPEQPPPQQQRAGRGAAAAPARTAAAEAPSEAADEPGDGCDAFDPAVAWPLHRRLQLPPLAAGQRFEDTYEVVTLIDSREQHRNAERLAAALRAKGFAAEVRGLPVGDMLWVARCRDGSGTEYVLDFVLERKSSQDLYSSLRLSSASNVEPLLSGARRMGATAATASHCPYCLWRRHGRAHESCYECSIKDGRYLSQKWRMLNCGLGGRLYLVETAGDWNLKGKGEKALLTARTTTQAIDGFTLLHSKDFGDERLQPNTVQWLCNLACSIRSRYSREAELAAAGAGVVVPARQPLMSPDDLAARVKREEEQALGGRAQWQLALMAMPGLSLAAAEAIVQRHPSPAALLRAVRQAGKQAVVAELTGLLDPVAGKQVMEASTAAALLQLLFPTAEWQEDQRRRHQQQQQRQPQQGQLAEDEADVIDLT